MSKNINKKVPQQQNYYRNQQAQYQQQQQYQQKQQQQQQQQQKQQQQQQQQQQQRTQATRNPPAMQNRRVVANAVKPMQAGNKKKYIEEVQYASEDEVSSDNYQNALMLSLNALSNKNNTNGRNRRQDYDFNESETDTDTESESESDSNDVKPTDERILFIRNILKGNKLIPMIDFDDMDNDTDNIEFKKKIMDIHKLFISMNFKMSYLKSGSTGHTFKAISKKDSSIMLAVKVCAYPKDDYGGITNCSRPENAELSMLKLFSKLVTKRNSPHFVLPIGTFNTSIHNFIDLPQIDLNDEKNALYKKFVKRYHKKHFENLVSVVISEWCNGGDLLDYIRKNYATITLKQWTIIFFQILHTLARIQQEHPAFKHNDLKANNILVQLTEKKYDPSLKYRYVIGNDTYFFIPNINLQIKIWDFDFASIDGLIENNKVNSEWANEMNITKTENKYYDMHYFFNTLKTERFFPQFYKGGVPQEIIEFVHRIVPQKYRTLGTKYVNKKGRIQTNTEYTTPYKVITEDPLFEKYRFKNIGPM